MKEELFEKIELLTNQGHHFFPQNGIIDVRYNPASHSNSDVTEQLLNSSYQKFCFDPVVTSLIKRETFESINEVSSGNNDLGYFKYLLDSIFHSVKNSNYYLSNYSGGRGDYFTVQKLVDIENAVAAEKCGKKQKYGIENICLTFGGQGAYAALGSYFSSVAELRSKEILFFDSTYCSNFRPFARHGLKISFMPTTGDSLMPSIEALTEYISKHPCSALFFVKFHNPSGETYDRPDMIRLLSALKAHDMHLFYAEAYETLDFKRLGGDDTRVHEILELADEVGFEKLVRVKTLSKDRGFAGLRAGYMIGPKEIIKHTIDYNDAIAYNPPMINSPLFVMNAYFQSRALGGAKSAEIEEWLGMGNIENLYDQFRIDEQLQLGEVFSNVRTATQELLSQEVSLTDCGSYLENSDFGLVVPEGGINMFIRVKFLEGFDQIDVFRKLYLDSGIILHTANFMCKREGFWVRFTLSHRKEKLLRTLHALKKLKGSVSQYNFLPQGSIRVTCGSECQECPLRSGCTAEVTGGAHAHIDTTLLV